MGPSKGTIKREYSHLTENWEVPQYDIRLMRRLKRRSIASEMKEHNYSANAKRKSVGSCGDQVAKHAENGGHVLEEEVDEDYECLSVKGFVHADLVSDDNIIASDVDVNTSLDSGNDDHTDSQYRMFLENFRKDDKSYVLKVFVDNQLVCVKYEGQEGISHDLVNNEIQSEGDDEDYQLFLNSARMEGDNLVYMSESVVTIKYWGSESEGKSSKVRKNLQVPFEVDELPNSTQASDDYHVAKNKCNSEMLSDVVDDDWQIYLNSKVRKNLKEKCSPVGQNLQVCDEAAEPPAAGQSSDDYHVAKNNCHGEVLSGVEDEDWQRCLNCEVRKNSKEKCSAIRQNLQVCDEAAESPNAGQASDDYHVAKNNCHGEVLSGLVDEDWQIYLNSEVTKKSKENCSAVRQNLQVCNEAAEPPNAGQASDDYHVAKNNCHGEVLSGVVDEDWKIYLNSEVRKNSKEKCSAVRQNLQVCKHLGASHVAKHKHNSKELCNIMDEDYHLFLKSVSTDGDNLIYMPKNGVTVAYGDKYDQSSADCKPIILDPSQHYEDSPSMYSKSYYSSCLADESNHKDRLYRKGLMEELERPYNQKEHEKLMQVVSHERTKVQHREMRHGVTKDRPKGGDDNKTSYLKMHSGLQDAIVQVKEPHKVLFLLRGFFYWLKHLPQGGAFRPWLDASCLKMLEKL